METLLRAAETDSPSGIRDRALVLLILYGALRRSEVASLDIDDVRPLGRHWVIDLPHRGSTTPGGYVKIPDHAAEAVQSLVEIYEEESGPLWRSLSNRNRGARMSPDALYKRIRVLGEAAKLGNLDIQTLRRSALRLASKEGASLEQVRRHARVDRCASTVQYVDPDSEEARLKSSAADFLNLGLDL